MAFLSFVHKKIAFNKNILYLWPDGILAKFLVNLKKVPGRKILSRLESSFAFGDIYLISSKNKKYRIY